MRSNHSTSAMAFSASIVPIIQYEVALSQLTCTSKNFLMFGQYFLVT
jgi:hypothetical protein